MTELIEASNYYQTRRHYAAAMESKRPGGKAGKAICATDAWPVEVFDQEHQDLTFPMWGGTPKRIATLPLCKRCERKAAKGGLEVPK